MDLFIQKLDDLSIDKNFIYDLDEINISSRKQCIVYFIKKNMKENINYIIDKEYYKTNQTCRLGGRNKVRYLLNKSSYDLLLNTYNFRIKTILDKECRILLPIETRSINIIILTFKDIFTFEKQKIIKNYRIDLLIVEPKIIVECDEFAHKDRDIEYEEERDKCLISNDYTIVRYNPNTEDFNITMVLNTINKIIIKKENINTVFKLY